MVVMAEAKREQLRNGRGFNHSVNHSDPHNQSHSLCLFPQSSTLSIPTLSLFLLLHFYILITTLQRHFSLVTTKLASHLSLSHSITAITLLSLGNDALNVFATLGTSHSYTGLSAILSASTFISALVVGFVAIYASPFVLNPTPFVKDVLFYLTIAFFLFYSYLSAKIFLWQTLAFIAFYFFFVAFVFYMDFRITDCSLSNSLDLEGHVESDLDIKAFGSSNGDKHASGLHATFRGMIYIFLFCVFNGDSCTKLGDNKGVLCSICKSKSVEFV
ncbi:hypothetical protein Fmac_008211 [Flemingia macrophylla]|uniref:Sodium/calcium exchanger membrane region domain-containing protein n=1 Tax=Flemingia macrophylla TaxID=520843 RepID=A0ABD1MWS0_9FABA